MAHLEVLIEILNEEKRGDRSSVKKALVFWDGFGSLAVAQQLRMLMLSFTEAKDVGIRIFRDVEKPFQSIDYPAVQFMIWDVRATADGMPVVIGQIMIHRMFPDRKSRPLIYYTGTGAQKSQEYWRQKKASR